MKNPQKQENIVIPTIKITIQNFLWGLERFAAWIMEEISRRKKYCKERKALYLPFELCGIEYNVTISSVSWRETYFKLRCWVIFTAWFRFSFFHQVFTKFVNEFKVQPQNGFYWEKFGWKKFEEIGWLI